MNLYSFAAPFLRFKVTVRPVSAIFSVRFPFLTSLCFLIPSKSKNLTNLFLKIAGDNKLLSAEKQEKLKNSIIFLKFSDKFNNKFISKF